MATPTKANFKIYQGSTFSENFRWENSKKVYKAITGITKAAPCVVTSATHGVPEGWRVKITNVVGMKEINDATNYVLATVPDANSIELNSINSLDYTAYTSGGVIEYNEPKDLTGFTARAQLREKLTSTTTLLELTTENGGIVINNTTKTISFNVTAAATAALTFTSAVYSLEMVSGTGEVTTIAEGTMTLVKEVTR